MKGLVHGLVEAMPTKRWARKGAHLITCKLVDRVPWAGFNASWGMRRSNRPHWFGYAKSEVTGAGVGWYRTHASCEGSAVLV